MSSAKRQTWACAGLAVLGALIVAFGALSPKPETVRTRHVAVTLDGKLLLDGARVDLEELMDRLRKFANVERDYDDPRGAAAATGRVILTADARTPWRHVGLVYRACSHPDVRILDIYWRVPGVTGPGLLPAHLHLGCICNSVGSPRVGLFRRKGAEPSEFVLDEERVPQVDLDSVLREAMRTRITDAPHEGHEVPVEVWASPEVTLGEVVPVVDRLVGLGARRILFGFGPPLLFELE